MTNSGHAFRSCCLLTSFTPPLVVAVPVASLLHPVPLFGPLRALPRGRPHVSPLVGLERETLQAYANADPANSREDEINAEDKSENVEGLVLANAPG